LSTVVTKSTIHQHFTSSFCADILAPKNYKAKMLIRKAAQNTFERKGACEDFDEINIIYG